MNRYVVLDTGVLSLLTHPHRVPASVTCWQWVNALVADADTVVLTEIADYELRRELLLRRASGQVRHLDALQQQLLYMPLTTAMMRQAAAFWASSRQLGQPTAPTAALDGDVILASQALSLAPLGSSIVVATTNVRHLIRFVDARIWQNIQPGQP